MQAEACHVKGQGPDSSTRRPGPIRSPAKTLRPHLICLALACLRPLDARSSSSRTERGETAREPVSGFNPREKATKKGRHGRCIIEVLAGLAAWLLGGLTAWCSLHEPTSLMTICGGGLLANVAVYNLGYYYPGNLSLMEGERLKA